MTWEETFSKNGDKKNTTDFKGVFELKTRIMTRLPTCFGVLFKLTLWYQGEFKTQEVL